MTVSISKRDKNNIQHLKEKGKVEIARRRYANWRHSSRSAKIYLCVLFSLADGMCPECGIDMILSFNGEHNLKDNSATFDHDMPLMEAQETNRLDLKIMCRKCNGEKGFKR